MRPVSTHPRTLLCRGSRLLTTVALAMATAVAATPTHADSGPFRGPYSGPYGDSYSGRASFGINDFGCRPSAAHPRPLVLLHGTFVNPTVNWPVGGPYFAERGYCVFELDYGQYAGIPLVHGIAPIEDSARQVAAFVDEVLAATGAGQVDIVGHSQGGGVLPRYYLKYLGGAAKVHTLVGFAPSNHGGSFSGIFTIAQQIPGATNVLRTACPACVEQFVGSEFNRRLDAGGDTVPGVHYTTIVTRLDDVVTPYTNQFLSGPNVHNVLLQDLCPLDTSGHVLLGTVDLVAYHEAANALDPAHATPTTCDDALSGAVTGALGTLP